MKVIITDNLINKIHGFNASNKLAISKVISHIEKLTNIKGKFLESGIYYLQIDSIKLFYSIEKNVFILLDIVITDNKKEEITIFNNNNPKFNSSINPKFNSSINPKFNSLINPKINSSFQGLIKYDFDLNIINFGVIVNNLVVIYFNYDLNPSFYSIKANEQVELNFDFNTEWISYNVNANKSIKINYNLESVDIGFIIGK